MKRRTTGQRGGARPGAGRKPVIADAVPLNLMVARRDLARLRAIARRKGVTVSEHVRGVLHRSLARSR